MLQLLPDGSGTFCRPRSRLARRPAAQIVVPHGIWQGSMLDAAANSPLLGCTVAPGFEYADYEPAIGRI